MIHLSKEHSVSFHSSSTKKNNNKVYCKPLKKKRKNKIRLNYH
jgi:hypothetical protein